MSQFSDHGGLTPRATRFALQMPCRYRRMGDPDWTDGVTQNISRTGVLFLAAGGFEPESPIEIGLVLQTTPDDPVEGEVICVCTVVRAVSRDGQPAQELAARICDYRFAEPQGARS